MVGEAATAWVLTGMGTDILGERERLPYGNDFERDFYIEPKKYFRSSKFITARSPLSTTTHGALPPRLRRWQRPEPCKLSLKVGT